MKIFIYFPFKDGPWGGGNQFLRALKVELERRGALAHTASDGDAILFNSHHNLWRVLALRLRYPKKCFIHRVDGPLSVVRGGGLRNRCTDRLLFFFSNRIADVTVFQSDWSRGQAAQFGYRPKKNDVVIHNAVDRGIFFPDPSKEVFNPNKKIRLIAVSWSANPRKGFDVYAHLDQHLDFSRFELVFVGNSPISFERGRRVPAMKSAALADELRIADIYVAASQNDPCSNALLEALACGLPAVYRSSGGHPELVQKGGVSFTGKDDVISAIETVVADYSIYHSAIPVYTIEIVAEKYKKLAQITFDKDIF